MNLPTVYAVAVRILSVSGNRRISRARQQIGKMVKLHKVTSSDPSDWFSAHICDLPIRWHQLLIQGFMSHHAGLNIVVFPHPGAGCSSHLRCEFAVLGHTQQFFR